MILELLLRAGGLVTPTPILTPFSPQASPHVLICEPRIITASPPGVGGDERGGTWARGPQAPPALLLKGPLRGCSAEGPPGGQSSAFPTPWAVPASQGTTQPSSPAFHAHARQLRRSPARARWGPWLPAPFPFAETQSRREDGCRSQGFRTITWWSWRALRPDRMSGSMPKGDTVKRYRARREGCIFSEPACVHVFLSVFASWTP